MRFGLHEQLVPRRVADQGVHSIYARLNGRGQDLGGYAVASNLERFRSVDGRRGQDRLGACTREDQEDHAESRALHGRSEPRPGAPVTDKHPPEPG